MNKSILNLLLLISTSTLYYSAFAQETQNFDSLIQINQNNFCYQTKDEQQGFKKFYQLNDNNKYLLLGIPVLAVAYSKPIIEVLKTQDMLEKNIKNKKLDNDKIKLTNIYKITHEVNLKLSSPALEALNIFYKKAPGLVFNSESYGAGYIFVKNEDLNIEKVSTEGEVQKKIDNQKAYGFNFNLISQGNETILNYKCEIKINTTKKPTEVAIDLVY